MRYAMKYSDFIDINKGFETSINLEYDLNKADKVMSYIPTEQSVKILGEFLKSFYYKKEDPTRATVLIGPYGRGKSHLLLILTALTSMDMFETENYTKTEARQFQLELCKRIEKVNPEIGGLAKVIVDQNIRALPIIINSNTTDINQAFLVALKQALQLAHLDSLLPSTYFDAAIEMIDKWKNDYPEAIESLTLQLRDRKKGLDDVYLGLKQCDQQAYEVFCECYPAIAAGAVFNPLTNMDVVKLYTSVANALCEQTEFNGINIIFDEFSKFLEANLDNSKMLNFKIIQDMAEAAVRSEDKQIHFTCITQKGILDYSSGESFKAVEGRFNQIQYVASSEQSYELIANAIPKRDSFQKLFEDHFSEFKRAIDSASIVNVFSELEENAFESKIVKGCFPLAPLTSFCLIRISELVGQNERTLFTFLAKPDPFALSDFLKIERTSIDFVMVDQIYDYFEELFKKEAFNTRVYSVWAKADSAIKQAEDIDQIKILKVIALILMIQDDRLKAIPSHIKASLMMDDESFDHAITSLLKKHILSQRDSSEFVILTANGVDVQKNVENFAASKVSKINRCAILMEEFPLGVEIPHEYNDRYEMLRFFKKIYMDATTILNYQSGTEILQDFFYDGLIVYVLANNEDENIAVINKLSEFKDTSQIIFVCTSRHADLEKLLKYIIAVNHLKISELASDPHYLEEIQFYEEDLRQQIVSLIDDMYSPSSMYSSYYNCNGVIDVIRQSDISALINNICLECYSKTPIINNEMVNKAVLNAQNLKGRNIVIDWIIQHTEEYVIPCMEGYGPEVSIFKSMFVHTGLNRQEHVKDEGINSVLELIDKFVLNSEGQANPFSYLYAVLQWPPYGIRKGIIPLFVAYVLRKYKRDLIIYHKDKEVELCATVLNAVNDSPEDYSILLEGGSREKEKMLDALENLFIKFSEQKTATTNRVYSIVRSMQNWMWSLPEYTKKFMYYLDEGEERYVDNSTNIIRKDLMQFDINPREMLFENWKSKLSLSGNLSECTSEIERVKEFLDNHILNFKCELSKYLVTLFLPGYNGSLSNAFKRWYETLPESTKTHLFDSEANSLLDLARGLTSYDDDKLMNEFALLFVAMAIEDWNDQLAQQFLASVKSCVDRINEYIVSPNKDQSCKISIDFNDEMIEKSFSNADISPLGMTVLNNLKAVFEEYNYAIDPDEQLAIIAALVNEIL